MKVKICGLFNPRDIDYVNEALPDYIGFVFAKSRRGVSYKTACEFKERLNPQITVVGVFVNAEIQDISRLYAEKTIDVAQLHGLEDAQYIKKLKEVCDIPVIKAVDMGVGFYTPPDNADFLLFDNGAGGTGQAFDWRLIKKLNSDKPFFLAGGINLDNIELALKTCDELRASTNGLGSNPHCLDISSGAETDGVKDRKKILKLVKAVKGG